MSRVLVDNWSLQEVAQIMLEGLSEDRTHSIEIDGGGKHIYRELPSAVTQIEALFDLLGELVLRDQLLVESKFTSAWDKDVPVLGGLREQGIILPYEFLQDPTRVAGPREALLRKLCVTSSLEAEHAQNEESWKNHGVVRHGLLSATLWGGAGMLARSHVFECPYQPHPLRRRFFENTGLICWQSDAVVKLNALVAQKRLAVFGRNSMANQDTFAYVSVPPIVVRAIENSTSLPELFKVAMQLRGELKDLRYWLGEFQEALDIEDNKRILRCREVYDSVSNNVERILGGKPNGVDMSFSIGIFKFSLKDNPVSRVMNKIGVRATINSLIFESEGKLALKKLLRMLDHRDSALGLAIYNHFLSRK